MADLVSMTRYYASLTDEGLAQEYARGRGSFASEEAWGVVVAEAQRRSILVPPGSTHTTDGVIQSIAWARSLTEDELVQAAARGPTAYPPSVWVLITVAMEHRGLTPPVPNTPSPPPPKLTRETLSALLKSQDEKAKESDGALAMWVFLGTAVVTLLGQGKLLSLGAFAYLLVGAFGAALLFGLVAYGLRRLIVAALTSAAPHLSDGALSVMGIGLLVMNVVLVLLATRWLTSALFS